MNEQFIIFLLAKMLQFYDRNRDVSICVDRASMVINVLIGYVRKAKISTYIIIVACPFRLACNVRFLIARVDQTINTTFDYNISNTCAVPPSWYSSSCNTWINNRVYSPTTGKSLALVHRISRTFRGWRWRTNVRSVHTCASVKQYVFKRGNECTANARFATLQVVSNAYTISDIFIYFMYHAKRTCSCSFLVYITADVLTTIVLRTRRV